VVSEEANIGAQEFIKRKIRELVKDPETARKLMPNELYARRPLCDRGYYQVFNRDNVELVHVKENPIVRITENAVVTADGVEHELDMLILATGFDAVDGNYKRMQIDGRDGISIADHWKGQPASVYGVMTAKFPNMFMVLGPNGPFTNLPPSIETQVEWISDAIKYANANGIKSIEPELAVEQAWTASCREMMYGTLFPKAESWIFGGNVPGKESTVYFYVGGLKTYRELLNTCAASQYEGFELVS
jgi:cation diffusion facilitator CzcD-associated flavoprotein CzcO